MAADSGTRKSVILKWTNYYIDYSDSSTSAKKNHRASPVASEFKRITTDVRGLDLALGRLRFDLAMEVVVHRRPLEARVAARRRRLPLDLH